AAPMDGNGSKCRCGSQGDIQGGRGEVVTVALEVDTDSQNRRCTRFERIAQLVTGIAACAPALQRTVGEGAVQIRAVDEILAGRALRAEGIDEVAQNAIGRERPFVGVAALGALRVLVLAVVESRTIV